MKVLKLVFLAGLLVITSCQKETIIPLEETGFSQSLETRAANVALPVKVHFFADYNDNWSPGQPNGWIGGQATHFGNLQQDASPFWYLGDPVLEADPDDPNFPWKVGIFNYLTAANGDRTAAIGYLNLNMEDGTFIGHFNMFDDDTNTGRFIGVEGYTNITADNPGYTDPATGLSYWEAEGELIFQ